MSCLALVVEGYGDVQAAPILARRILADIGAHHVVVPSPVRLHRGRFLKGDHVGRAVSLALQKCDGPRGVLILFDSDGHCPVELSSECSVLIGERINTRVVVAHNEFEAWFVAALASLRGQRGVSETALFEGNPDELANPKRVLAQHMTPERGYSETVDQPAFAATMDIELAAERSRSFRKFRTDIESLAAYVSS